MHNNILVTQCAQNKLRLNYVYYVVNRVLVTYVGTVASIYTTGIIERGCGRETNKARGVAECLIRSRDHIRVQ